jgi:hypothetical protein
MQFDPELTSAHFGKTKAGADFKEFLGEDEYENHIIAAFDDFLHESFSTCRNPDEYARMTNLLIGPEVCKSRACGMLGSKENSPAVDEDWEDDNRSASRSPNLERLENNKRLIQFVDEHLKKSKPGSLNEALDQMALAKNIYG